MEFINYGYYIVEPVLKAQYMALKCKEILTVSACVCDQHPILSGSFWSNHGNEQIEYQKRLKLSDEEFTSMRETISLLFGERKLDCDSRFVELSDALNLYRKYLFHLPSLQIVSVALEPTYIGALLDETKNTTNILSPLNVKQEGGALLGYDILGWDCESFHTYLCNELDKDILGKFPLEVNELGLIQNPYMQVKKFVEYIADMVEPVLWLPVAVYQHAGI